MGQQALVIERNGDDPLLGPEQRKVQLLDKGGYGHLAGGASLIEGLQIFGGKAVLVFPRELAQMPAAVRSAAVVFQTADHLFEHLLQTVGFNRLEQIIADAVAYGPPGRRRIRRSRENDDGQLRIEAPRAAPASFRPSICGMRISVIRRSKDLPRSSSMASMPFLASCASPNAGQSLGMIPR